MMDWQTIETAPRDGTVILMWDDLMGFQVGWYGAYPDHLVEDMDSKHGWHDGAFPVIGDGGEPTHWTPLTAPRGTDEEESE